MTKKTTRDEINIDLDGSIDEAIAELRRMKKLYPKGEVSLENEYEYGESYARLKLRFTRPMEPVEIELEKWRTKRRKYDELSKAAAAYKREGDVYPRAAELKKLGDELGCFADSMAELVIFGGEVIAMDYFRGGCTRDGKVRLRSLLGMPPPELPSAPEQPPEEPAR